MQYFAPVSLYIKAKTLMTASKITVIAIIKSIEVKYLKAINFPRFMPDVYNNLPRKLLFRFP